MPPQGAAEISWQGHNGCAASANPSLELAALQGHPLPPAWDLLVPPELTASLLSNLRCMEELPSCQLAKPCGQTSSACKADAQLFGM